MRGCVAVGDCKDSGSVLCYVPECKNEQQLVKLHYRAATHKTAIKS